MTPALAALLLLQSPVFRAEVRLVRLLATVKDPSGNPVGSLPRDRFRVFDNGVVQQISVFERSTGVPLSIAILVDTSGSTIIRLKSEVASVRSFLDAVIREGNEGDAAALYSFNYQVSLEVPFTRRKSRFDHALKALKGEAGTSLYDALWFASRDLMDRDGRKVIVAITDGGDTVSGKTFLEALEAVHRADAIVYPLLVMPIQNDAGRNVGGENALTQFAAGTGGKVFSAAPGKELDRALTQILADLRTQYLLGYYPQNLPRQNPPQSSDPFHRVRVELENPGGLQVSTRSGYYGDSTP